MLLKYKIAFQGGAVAPWLARSSSDRAAVRVRFLAGDIVLCSWARHFTLTVPLSTQVYKWVQAYLLGVTLRRTSIPSRGMKYSWSLHATETGKKLRADGLIGCYEDFTFQDLGPVQTLNFTCAEPGALNLIPIRVDPNDKVRRLIQKSNLI